MGKIKEKDGVILGYHGDIAFSTDAFVKLLTEAGYNLYDETGRVDDEALFELAFRLNIVPVSLERESGDYHFIFSLANQALLESSGNSLYICLERAKKRWLEVEGLSCGDESCLL